MGRNQYSHSFNYITSLENLLAAWPEFLRGKRGRRDVQRFGLTFMGNIITLHQELRNRNYRHSDYRAFNISDPKPRRIHKANVRDRLLHHAVYRKLSPFFNKTFIADSYSCRPGKGTHKAINQFRKFAGQSSRNHTITAWVLKCDIKKFFASIDHFALNKIISYYLPGRDVRRLLSQIIDSFHANKGKGLPLGNLTSQLLVNIYMNEFDQFVKHKIKARHYIRYADDFVFLSDNKSWLEHILPPVSCFLKKVLYLSLNPDKVFIKTLAAGIDYLGWVHFEDHRVLRTATKRRMFRTAQLKNGNEETVQSYLGLLKHGNADKWSRILREIA